MARYHGIIGYGESVEEPADSGIWIDEITEVSYAGDVVRDIKSKEPGESVSDTLKVNNAISIVADRYAIEHYHEIRYIEWEGRRWTITSVEVRHPRLIINLGEVYNGPTPVTPPDP